MVKYSACKTRLSQNFKNLRGLDTTLKIDKQGKCVSVTLEQKNFSWARHNIFTSLVALCILFLFYVGIRDVNVTKYITAIVIVLLLYQFLSAVYEESFIMVHSLGYQIISKSIIGQKDLFIPWNQVQSIFINEVIIRHKVIHLLTMLTKDEDGEKLIPLFLELQPRLKHLELICKHLKGANS